ncbi:UDP-N-acetylglucosamine 1-carboxyvinyltransferase [hydrothermal vent metagenome]|uniref:UDP-N-acetylglucosamine 1-carboxyvinyltransferase n=1 Tax=hydrothermal vent metagenome TaxID=652676 RepID=A0A3B1BR67_9ZZZZ
MDRVVIEGGARLRGEVKVSGAKNAALPIFTATLLAEGEYELSNIPDLQDIRTIALLIEKLGARVTRTGESTYTINSENVNNHEAPYDLVRTMRASCLVMGPLTARLGRARVSLPGGCAIGERPIDQHLKGLRALGADIKIDHGYVDVKVDGRFKSAPIFMDIITVTGTMNLMMAATLADGLTVIKNAAKEPEVVALAGFLNDMGAKIDGAGSDTLSIEGVGKLHSANARIIPDRIEAGTYMVASAITGGDVTITGVDPQFVRSLSDKLSQSGCAISESETGLRVKSSGSIRPVDVTTAEYPGFPTDMQAQIMALMTLADGASIITESIFENRFMHVGELRRMGADINISGATATIRGVPNLSGAPLMATDLRASASLILAGLAAKGETTVSRIYHLDRGYEHIEAKLKRIGASIRREKAGKAR